MDLERLKRLCDASTPGPWIANEMSSGVSTKRGAIVGYPSDSSMVASLYDGEYIENENREHDAAFIAEARTALPELIAEVELLRWALGHYANNSMSPYEGGIAREALARHEEKT